MPLLQQIKHHLMAGSREKKYRDFIALTSPSPSDAVLDVGAADKEFSPHDNYLAKTYPYRSRITALSIQGLSNYNRRYPEIKTVTYQGGRFPFADKAFSVVHSNAVIEHVGGRDAQLLFIQEMARCGRRVFFSTPAREFLFEMHTNYPLLHWLPKPVFDRLITRLGKGWAAGGYMHLLTSRGLGKLLQQARIENYRVITYKTWGVPCQHVVFAWT